MKCTGCRKNDGEKKHTCPFAEDIHNDKESKCNCCRDCERECAADI